MDFKGILNFVKRNRKLLLFLILAFIEIFDLFCLSLIANNRFTTFSESLLGKLRFNTLTPRPVIYDDMLRFTTYVLSFVVGGTLVFVVVKLTGKLAKGKELINYEALSLIPLALFVIIFLSGSFATNFSTRWLNPLLTYVGGVFLYFLSCIKMKVNY
ncbi:MAG TPA: hypothetical protein PLI11_00825 [Clostridia bacterium]|nr:hypothetical protein [Clostridiaceae bacterium]HOA31329.1 hypothetical protein [Clostridia bacterium]HPZ51440.1 hypothetical protein [Clostridia bacterium]